MQCLMTGIELELISDIYMQLYIEKGMRVGISYVAKNIVKQIRNTWGVMIVVKKVNTLLILVQKVYMAGQ